DRIMQRPLRPRSVSQCARAKLCRRTVRKSMDCHAPPLRSENAGWRPQWVAALSTRFESEHESSAAAISSSFSTRFDLLNMTFPGYQGGLFMPVLYKNRAQQLFISLPNL